MARGGEKPKGKKRVHYNAQKDCGFCSAPTVQVIGGVGVCEGHERMLALIAHDAGVPFTPAAKGNARVA